MLGAEYSNLATPRKPNAKQKKKIDHIIDDLKPISEDEAKAIFEGMEASIYTPAFKKYLETFWNTIKEQTKIKSDYDLFKSTALYEKYMLNNAQFSSAKSVAINGMMKTQLFDDKGVRKSFSAFKSDCKAITDISNDTWLRTEYDTSLRTAIAGEQFRSFKEDSDLYGWWLYLETTSAHPREEHLLLVGNVYKIGDPEGDDVFPPNGFSCSCGAEQVDEQYLKDNNKTPRTNDEAKEDLVNGVPEQFRFNPYKQGILPKEGHSYFNALPNANEADGSMFSDLE